MHSSIENMAKSVTKETKAKFESLLKLALNKKDSKSVQNLLEADTNVKEATSGHTREVIEMQEEIVSKNFILDKFLNDEEVKENDSGSFVVPPVPKPRKKVQQQSSGSNETFSVKSANVLNVINRNTDSDGNDIYDLPKRWSKDDSDTSASSAKTYNVNKTSVIGDILYEDRICKASIVELNRQSPAQRSVKSQKISEHEIEMANFHEEMEKIQTIEDIVEETDIRSIISETSTRITFENELKGKKKKKEKERATENVEGCSYKYENIVGIVVHNTDRLELDFFVIHPVVKVYLVDYETGEYIKKTDSSRGAVFHVESTDLTYIMPVITQNYNLQENRRFKPEWEETIIINEDFTYVTNPATRTILFFELLDFVGFSEAALQSSVYSRGWHRIAWAFLKLNAANGSTNTERKLRLQLYKPEKDIKNSCPVFDWWRGKTTKYPSTLYVTVKMVTCPNVAVETFRSKTPLEKEKIASTPDDGVEDFEDKDAKVMKEDKEKVKAVLSALDSKIWRLPNNTLSDIDSGEEGCFALKFSNTGRFLACAVLIKKNYCLMLYTVPEFETYYKLPAHQELIYNISFAKDDSYVASSSSDGTVCVWNLEKLSFQQILPHPSFVYWCEFSKDQVIATGCYDKTVRVWASGVDKVKKEYFLVEELVGHAGYVTSLCFNSVGNILFSSDSKGEIFLWKRADRSWKHLKAIKLPDLKDTVINQILLHKRERKVIVHARDNIIRIVDVKNECILHWLEGALNNRVRTLCCITPCFSHIASGSENGTVHVWNATTAKSVATYHPYDKLVTKYIPVHAVDFSPVGNLMAVSHFGRPIPIFVHNFDHKNCKDKLYITDEKPSHQYLVHKSTKERDCSEEKEDSEKDIDWKNILEKIDRIIS